MSALTELRNRGVVFFVVGDGLKGLPDSVTWPMATVQVCITHLDRRTFRYAARKYWDEFSKDCARSAPPSAPRLPRRP